MIFICCRKRDPSLPACQLEAAARESFSIESQAYIDAIAQRKNQESRADSLFALCLLSSLCDRAGEDKNSLTLCRDESGRPFFKDSRLDFSISHSKGTVAIALSDVSRVGIDIELSMLTQKRAYELARRYFAPEEVESVKNGVICGEKLGESEVFRRIWTEKEAYAKMSGIPLPRVLPSGEINDGFVQHVSIGDISLALCSSSKDKFQII